MNYCNHCGALNDDVARHCINCGKEIDKESEFKGEKTTVSKTPKKFPTLAVSIALFIAYFVFVGFPEDVVDYAALGLIFLISLIFMKKKK